MTNPYSVKRQILASQIAYKRSLNNEQRLERDLSRFFAKLKEEVLTSLEKYWKDYQMLQGHMDLILSPVHEAHKEYYDILSLYVKKEYKLGRAEGKRLVKNATRKHKASHKSMQMPVHAIIKRDNDLFATLPSAEERLLNRTFRASERTMARVDSQISSILTDGYRSGKGIDSISNELTRRFDQLTSWESKRIARTEIHNSHNTAVMDTYKELDVEYTMWVAAEDERTRDSHLEINGEIIPMGGTYSNGLAFPGDTSGDIEEWINCRCSNAPFVIPYGYMAPSFAPFREDDLVKVETKDPQQIIEQLQEDTSNDNQNWIESNYEATRDGNSTIYSFENGMNLKIDDNAPLTFEEVKTHIASLPKELQTISNDSLNNIHITGDFHRQWGGVYVSSGKRITVYNSQSKEHILDTFTHELAHAFDYSKGVRSVLASDEYGLSHLDVYGKIVEADNKLYAYVRPNGKTRIPNKFPTDYAGRSWVKSNKMYKQKIKTWEKGSKNPSLKPNNNAQYVEDFADSTKLYLNPTNHAKFVEEFPNRAKYLEKLYGKPKFK